MNKDQQIKIIWNDAKMFSPKNKNVALSIMETSGVFEAEYNDYFLIKNPVTINTKTGQKHPEQTPSFYLIPKGMVHDFQYIK